MHEEDDPVDFSLLDPSRDAARWDSIVASVAARARARRRSLARELVRRGVPAFAMAAAAAATVWLAAPSRNSDAATAHTPADVVTAWALGGAADPRDLVMTEGDHGSR